MNARINKIVAMLAALLICSCAPVLNKDVMRQGIFDATLSDIKTNPVLNRGKLYIMGGVIAKTTLTQEGSLIEAIYVPVNSRGYLKSLSATNGRFLALYKSRDILDPLIFREQREITLAATFIGTRPGKIDEMEYTFPLFEIKEIYLWEEKRAYDYEHYPPYPYYPPWYYRYPYYDPFYPWPRYR